MKKWIVLVTIVVLLAALGVWRIGKIRGREVAQSIDQIQLETGVPVRVFVVKRRDLKETVEVSGSIAGWLDVAMAPTITERVEELHVKTGGAVRKGDLLVTLDPVLSKLELEQAEASLAEAEQKLTRLVNGSRPEEIEMARAEVERSEADLALAKSEWERQKQLHEEEVSSVQSLQQAQAGYGRAQAQVASARANYELMKQGPRAEDIEAGKAGVALARAMQGKARKYYDDHFLRAPCDGVVSKNGLEAGDVAEANLAIFRVVDVGRVYLDIDVSELHVPRIEVGMAVEVKVDVLGERVFAGTIAEINPIAREGDRSFGTRIAIDNQDGALRPGMFGRARIITGRIEGGMALPADTVKQDGEQQYVLCVDGSHSEGAGVQTSKAARRDVTVGETFGEMVHVISGIEEGMAIIALSQGIVTPGSRVVIAAGGE